MSPATSSKSISLSHHRSASGLQQRLMTRARIIECSIPVFAEHGPDAPAIDVFVKAAGISRGTFYNYFRTTRELLDATFASLSDEVIATIVPVVEDMSNPVVRYATAARIYYHWATADPTVAAFLSSASHIGTLALERSRRDLQEAMQAGLIEMQDIDLALAVGTGVMVFALRTPRARAGGDAGGLQVVGAILSGLGVARALRTKALAIQLPDVPAARARRN